MANGTKDSGSNGTPYWLKMIGQIAEKHGFSVVFLGVITYVALFDLGPKLVESHTAFLKRTGDTQDVMSDTLKDLKVSTESIDDGIKAVVETGEQTKEFMQEVKACHDMHTEKLDAIYDNVKQ